MNYINIIKKSSYSLSNYISLIFFSFPILITIIISKHHKILFGVNFSTKAEASPQNKKIIKIFFNLSQSSSCNTTSFTK